MEEYTVIIGTDTYQLTSESPQDALKECSEGRLPPGLYEGYVSRGIHKYTSEFSINDECEFSLIRWRFVQ